MKDFNLKLNFEKILKTKKYYIKYNRNKKISYNDYLSSPIDPNGKKRNLFKEEKYKLSQLKVITKFLNKDLIKKKRKILDYGCGFGWMLKNLDNKYWKKYGIEVNETASKIAKQNKIIVEKSLDLIKIKKFDIISLIHVIEHLRNPIRILNKIKKKIKSNGYLIVETPDFDSAMARRYNKKFRLLHDKTHISLFSSESLIRLIRDTGFKIIRIEYPYFEGPFFTKKNIMEIFNKDKKKNSPPFYGSVVTIFAKKNNAFNKF